MRIAPLFALAAVMCLSGPPPAQAESTTALDATIADVAKRWPAIRQLSQDEVINLTADGSAVLFDVRTAQEYAVSRIAGAIEVDPDMHASDFLRAHGEALRGKTAIFYCSVGVRSSRLAERVTGGLKASGAAGVANLKGGIFAWANQSRPLVNANGPATKVHGFDARWSKMIDKPEQRTTAP